jgi:hypothetical protein
VFIGHDGLHSVEQLSGDDRRVSAFVNLATPPKLTVVDRVGQDADNLALAQVSS